MSGIEWSVQDYVYVAAECTNGLFTMLGNALVLLAIKRTRSLRTVTNCFIGSLAAADLLVGIVIPPTVIFSYLGLPRDFHGCVLTNSIVVIITNISIFNLLMVALERFLAVKNPFLYQRVMTVKRAMTVVVLTWIVAIILGLIPNMGWNQGSQGFQTCSFTAVIDLRYMVYLNFFGITLPLLIVMLGIYVYIFYIIRKQQRRSNSYMHVLSRADQVAARQRRREVRGAKGLAYVIILFAICWLPINIMNSLTVFSPKNSAPFVWLLAAIILSHVNSVVNPFLYAFSNSKFKRAMAIMLCCGRTRLPGEDSTTMVASRQSRGRLKSIPQNIARQLTPDNRDSLRVISTSSNTTDRTTCTIELPEQTTKQVLETVSNGVIEDTRDNAFASKSLRFQQKPEGSQVDDYTHNPSTSMSLFSQHNPEGSQTKHTSSRISHQTVNLAQLLKKTVLFNIGGEVKAADKRNSPATVWATPASQGLQLESYPTQSPAGRQDSVFHNGVKQQGSSKNVRSDESIERESSQMDSCNRNGSVVKHNHSDDETSDYDDDSNDESSDLDGHLQCNERAKTHQSLPVTQPANVVIEETGGKVGHHVGDEQKAPSVPTNDKQKSASHVVSTRL